MAVQRGLARRIGSRVPLKLLVALVLAVVFGLPIAAGAPVTHVIQNVTFAVVLAALLLSILPWIERRAARKQYRSDAALQGEFVYSFSDEGFDYQTAVGRGHVDWSAYRRAAEDNEFIYLFQSTKIANFIPKSAFPTPTELAEFRSLLARQVSDTAALRL